MPLNLKYPSVPRRNTTSKKTDGSTAAVLSSSPPADSVLGVSATKIVPEQRPKQSLFRKQTDPTPPPTLARQPSQASIYSTVSKTDKKRSAWRGVAKSLPHMLKSSRGASSTSLVSVSQEPEPPLPDIADTPLSASVSRSKIPVRRTTLSPKASTLIDKRSATPPNAGYMEGSAHGQGRDSDERTSAELSDGSGTMVEDYQSTARSLGEELSATRQQLIEVTNECSALHEHIRTLEGTHAEQIRQRVEEAVNHAKDELFRIHGSEQDTIRTLERKNEELASRIILAERAKEGSDHSHTTEVESLRFKTRNLQHSLESLQHDLKARDNETTRVAQENEGLHGRIAQLEEESRVLAEGGAEAQRKLLEDIAHLRHQLEHTQHALSERDGQISGLQSARAETENLLICAQATVDEKDMVVGDLQRRGAGLEERNDLLEKRVFDLEREIVEAKDSAQNVLKATIDDYERRIADAAGDVQALRDQLTSSTSTIQQLQSSLDASLIDAKKATQTATEAANELRQIREQHLALQGTVQALEDQNKAYQAERAELVRIHSAEIEAERRAIHNLRRSMETFERKSGAKDERSLILVQTNEELRQEIMGLKELRERDEQESDRLQKELSVANAALCSFEEKNRSAMESLMEEKGKLITEIDRLRRQLEEAQGQLQERDSQAQNRDVDEQKRKDEVQKALSTIDEQKIVIARLQQSVGEQSKEDRQQPRLLLNVMKATPTRTNNQRPRSSSSASHTARAKPPPPTKRYTTDGSEAPYKQNRDNVTAAPSTSSTPLKVLNATTSSAPLSHDASKMLKDHERAFQTDSDSEGDHQSGSQRQVKDVKRLRQQTQAGLVYRMGHAVFGSLWRRVWG